MLVLQKRLCSKEIDYSPLVYIFCGILRAITPPLLGKDLV
jgi:hypothetical protein